jgi:hypothetical protein
VKGPLFDFVEEPDVPAFKLAAVRRYEASLNSDERPKLAFDPDYLTYLKVAHGRALRNCRFKLGNQTLPIDRIFSYARREDLKGPSQPSWRPGADDVRMDYSVPSIGGMPNWAEDGVIVPFAGVGARSQPAGRRGALPNQPLHLSRGACRLPGVHHSPRPRAGELGRL